MNGSMTRTPNGRWRVRWRDPDGTGRSKTFDQRTEAKLWLTFVRHKTAMQELPTTQRVAVGEWVDGWLERKRGTLKQSTFIDYVSIVSNHLPTQWRPQQVSAITRSSAQRMITQLVASGRAGRARKVRAVLSACFAEAVADGLTPRNPFARVAIRDSDRTRGGAIVCPSPADVWRLADIVPPWARGVVLTAGFAGLRWGEVIGLPADAIDLRANEIEVRRTYSIPTRTLTDPKSQASHRRAVFSAAIRDELAAAVLRADPGGLAFPSQSGGFIDHSTFRRRVWLPSTTALGMDGVRFHDLRHTYASTLIAAGATPPLVAAMLGHSSPAVTLDVYANFWNSQKEGLSDRIAEIAG